MRLACQALRDRGHGFFHLFVDKSKAEAWYETMVKKEMCDIIHFGQISKVWHKEDGNE